MRITFLVRTRGGRRRKPASEPPDGVALVNDDSPWDGIGREPEECDPDPHADAELYAEDFGIFHD